MAREHLSRCWTRCSCPQLCLSIRAQFELVKCYAGDAATEKYIVHCVDSTDWKIPIMSNTKIITSIWNQKRGRLAHKLKSMTRLSIIKRTSLSSIINWWKIPKYQNIIDLDQFAGKLVHTAVWDTTYDWLTRRSWSSEMANLVFKLFQPSAQGRKNWQYVRYTTWVSISVRIWHKMELLAGCSWLDIHLDRVLC